MILFLKRIESAQRYRDITVNYLQIAKSLKAKKRLGQNFLVNPLILDKIIEAANPSCDETIIEIGPGAGFVTSLLADRCKEIIAVELDEDMIAHLNTLQLSNLKLVHDDILNIEFKDLVGQKVKVVANIPYYITTPILLHLIGEVDDDVCSNREHVSEIILMVQEEVGRRIVATNKSKNKEWGALSILVNYWCAPEIICKVPARSFWPAPKVDSVLIKITLLEKPSINVNNRKLFRRIVKAAFNFRRKTLKNALFLAGLSQEVVLKSLSDMGLKDTIRGESLSLEEFGQLTNSIESLLNEVTPANASN